MRRGAALPSLRSSLATQMTRPRHVNNSARRVAEKEGQILRGSQCVNTKYLTHYKIALCGIFYSFKKEKYNYINYSSVIDVLYIMSTIRYLF